MDGLERWIVDFSAMARSDGYAVLLRNEGHDVETLTDPEARGEECLAAQIHAVSFVLGFRGMNRDPSDDLGVESFLHHQRYRPDGEAPETRYAVRLIGPRCPAFQVDDLGELDFEDLRSVLWYDAIQITDHQAAITEEEAEALVAEVEQDLTYDGDTVELSAECAGRQLVIEVRWVEGWD